MSRKSLHEWWGDMSDEQDLAHSYRLRSEELRALAELDRDRQTRETLLGIARDYDRMAQSFDAIERTNRAIARVRGD